MGLPKVKFIIADNGLGRIATAIQKVPGLVITGASVADKVTLGESNQVSSLDQAEALGITVADNPFAYKHIKAFYDEAGTGATLWFMLVSDATTYTLMADKTEDYLKKLIVDAKGAIRIVGLVKKGQVGDTIANGIDSDVTAAVVKLQELADEQTTTYRPFRSIISGNKFSGTVADLNDYDTATYDRVNMLLWNDDAAEEASIGLALGRLAAIPTQRKMNRVADGPIAPLVAYFTKGEPVETLADSWDLIDDKRYTFVRSFTNRSGYFMTGDKTLVANTNDFSTLSRGLVMDKAVLIANDTLTDELSGEVPLTTEGYIHPAIVKGWQNNIETQLNAQMVANGELSGVKAFIDEKQNILEADELVIRLDLQPVGYSDFITVNIGFTTTLDA